MRAKKMSIKHPPERWERLGQVMERGQAGAFDSSVTGDPCIVWDEARGCYHMVYFAQKQEGDKEVNSNAHAISRSPTDVGPGAWRKLGPLAYANPGALSGDTHKPWILLDPYRPGVAARVDGAYWLFTVSFRDHHKVIQAATSASLDGPWRVQREPVVDVGPPDAFDGYHADCITAYWFEDRGQMLLFYSGYPQQPQPDQPHSPYGNSSAAAVMRPGDTVASKLGKVLSPASDPNHWMSGYIGGLQILPAERGGWYAVLNASPTPPAPVEEEPEMREPAPSLGGWAYTPQSWPVSGWQALDQPIEWIDDVPPEARRAGEGVNLWRHHVLVLPDGAVYLYYNSGSYGQERMFARRTPADRSPVVWREE